MKKVIIASKNPVKINATKKAFEEVFNEHFEFEGVSADSSVSDQPMSNKETLQGALMVLLMAVVMSLFFLLLDQVLKFLLELLLKVSI